MTFHKYIFATGITLLVSYSLAMDKPLKYALKKEALEKEKKHLSDTQEKKDPFPTVTTIGVSGTGKFSPDSKYLVAPFENKIALYDTQTCTKLGTLQNSYEASDKSSSDLNSFVRYGLYFSPRSTYLTDKYEKHVWTVADRVMIYQGSEEKDKTQVIGWTPDEKKRFFLKKVTTGDCSTFYCQQRDFKTDHIEKEFKVDCCNPKSSAATISPNGKLLAYGATIASWKKYHQKLFNIEQEQEKCIIPNGTVTKFTPDSNYALVGILGAKLMIIDTGTGAILKEVNCDVFPNEIKEEHPLFLNRITIDAFKTLVTTNKHWKRAAFKIPELTRLEHLEKQDTVIPSTNGKFLLHLSKDQSTTGALLEDTLNQTKKNLAVSIKPSSEATFSPTDEIVVVESYPKKHVFDTATGALLYTFEGYFQLSPNGKHLLIHKKNKLEVLVNLNRENS